MIPSRVCWYLILSVCLFSCSAKSFGEVHPLPGAASFRDARITLHHHVADGNITFWLKHNSYGYIGLLYGEVMRSGDFTIVQISEDGVVTVGDFHTGSTRRHEAPQPDEHNHIRVLGWETDGKTHVTVKFTRKLDTGDRRDTRFRMNSTQPICYAVRKDSKVLDKHQQGEYECFDIQIKVDSHGNQLNSATLSQHPTADHSPVKPKKSNTELHDLVFKHGMGMTFAWCILADVSIIVLFCKGLRWRGLIHGIIFTLVLALTAFTVYVMLQEFNPLGRHLSVKGRTHFYLGVGILAWVVLQGLVGWVVYAMFWLDAKACLLIRLKQIHKWSGYILIVLCKLQVMLGWWMYHSPIHMVGVVLVGADLCLFMLGLCWWSYCQSQPIRPYSGFEGGTNETTEQTMQLYNSPLQKRLAPYIIYNDWVYLLKQGFHPGGQRIIDAVRYREVDRYLYGMYPVEDQDGDEQHTHSSRSIEVLGHPIGRVPANPMYVLSEDLAQIQTYDSLSERLLIFYLNANATFREQSNLRHVGQYWRVKLRRFPLVRLYTCVSCLTIANRSVVRELLSRLGVAPAKQNPLLNDKSLEQQINLVPLVIRYYPERDGFTKKLIESVSSYPQQNIHLVDRIELKGLLGRGLGLDRLPYGTVVMFAGGTGLFPYLDLIDLIFKVVASERLRQSNPQIDIYRKQLQPYAFKLYLAADCEEELVIPDQLAWMAQANSPLFTLKLKLKKRSTNRFTTSLTDERFDEDFIRRELVQNERVISMVYVCGPLRMYREVIGGLRAHLFPESKIYIV